MSSVTQNDLQTNLEAYWESDYYADNTKFELNNYIFDVSDAVVYLVGDIEGDYAMIFNWFIENKIIDNNLNWVAASNVYIIQAGDQVDKFSNTFLTDKGRVQPTRRQRNKDINSFGSDLDVVIFFDYLQFASKMRYGSERVIPLLGNHEVMNLHEDLRYAYDHSSSNSFAKKEKQMLLNIMNNDGSPINNILMKRPVITRFNNLVVSHAGLSLEAIKFYSGFYNRDFELDEFIEDINKLSPDVFIKENIYYLNVVEPLLWNRKFDEEKLVNEEQLEETGENIIVLGHNSYKNVVLCDDVKCDNFTDYIKDKSVDNIKMIKVDTSRSSRFCQNDRSEIYTARITFKDNELTNIEELFYGFNCESAKYPGISFVVSKKMLPYFGL